MSRVRCFALAAVCVLGVVAFATSPAEAQWYGGVPPVAAPNHHPSLPPPVLSSEAPWYGGYTDHYVPPPTLGRPRLSQETFLRAEFINMNLESPGNVLLGSPIAGNPNPTTPFPVFSGGTFVGTGRVASLAPINLNSMDGIRVTGGADLVFGGKVEVSAFVTERKTGVVAFDNLSQFGNIVATSTLVNGQIANNLETYNRFFRADYSSQMWGGEANYFLDLKPNGFFQLRPLFGGRYMNLSERLIQKGQFQSTAPLPGLPPINTAIESNVVNNLWGGQVGLRGEFVHDVFTIGGDAKFGLMGNTGVFNSYVENFRFTGDTPVSSSDHFSRFTPMTDLSAFARINITPLWRIQLGYQFLWINDVVRPGSLYYNVTTPANPVDIRVNTDFHSIVAHVFSVGTEFRW
jgi:hypothetical protein